MTARTSPLIPVLMLICTVTITVLSAGCTATADPGPVRIGVLLPASGPLATHSIEGLAWAVDALNRHGGVDGRAIELVYRDTSAGNISGYAEELAGREDIDVIIGPATSAELVRIAPLVTERGKILISPSATSGLVTAEYRENELVWRTCSADGEQLKAIFGTLRDTGVRNVSLVAANTTYGETFARLAPAAAAMTGVRLTGTTIVEVSDNFTEVAARIGEEGPDMVVAAVYPEEAAGIADALAATGSPAGLFLTDAARSPYLIESLGERAEGIRGTSLSSDPSTGYAIAYEEVFGEAPPAFAAQTYDALLLAVYTAARQEAAPKESPAASLRRVVSGDGIVKGWDPQEASEAATMIRAGARPSVTGASGPLRFGEHSSAGPLAGYYTRWTVEGGEFCENTPVASADVTPRLPGLSSPGAAGDGPVIWMVYPLAKGDRSFADTAYRGLFRAQESYDFTKREFSYDDLALLDAVFAARNFTEKPDLVITEGFQFADASRAWAETNPDIRFFTLEQANYGLPNACDAVMVPYGASYLAGVMAANMTETGRIGAIAGAPVAVIDPFVEGFRAGAAAYDPSVNVTVRYVGESFEGFGMPERAGAIARDLRREGVDVVLMIAGSSNTGIVDAARETSDVYLIGEDTDQSYLAPNLVVASVVKEIDAIVYHAAAGEVDGTFTPGQEVWTLENGGTGLFVSPRFSEYGWVAADWQERAVAAEKDYLGTAAV
ncbi:BMP family ABC transporter substrate-binding protein [Methanoculleus sp. Wushi-C6]|uniref:BMP family ABC transporter substrate-binding protein n=1 Tax=Methanoculleus caldifontis TaxID=2651577 RepID=A0ABU3X1H9_9EURY|nr:BMP family ABC transporter substrate-binding protein [Methanoculleus sp. Wushi-C6]MDV2481919.1 BMP family ABC transporter substrate-binding protein [Methanoculleus sp. Wushi-C6]